MNPSRDLTHVMSWVNDPSVMGYFANHEKPISPDDELRYLTTLAVSNTDRVFSVFDDDGTDDGDGGRYLGQCSINQIHWPSKNGRIFLALCANAQGKGYAPRILAALIDQAKGLDLHKLWLIVREESTRAIAKYEKVGFVREGLLRDHYRVHGVYYNMVQMGLILA